MDLMLEIGASFVVTGLMFFIFHNAIKTANYKRRAVYFMLFGLFLLMALTFGIYKDFRDGKLIKVTFSYLVFPLTVVFMIIVFVVTNLLNAKRYHHTFHKFSSSVNSSKQEYLYIVFKYKDYYLLSYDDNNYQGIVYKFDNKVFFHDDMMEKVINRLEIDLINKRFCGTVSKNQKKKKTIYYCYEITVKSKNSELDKYQSVSKYDMTKIEAEPFHKNIILRILINEQFKIDE